MHPEFLKSVLSEQATHKVLHCMFIFVQVGLFQQNSTLRQLHQPSVTSALPEVYFGIDLEIKAEKVTKLTFADAEGHVSKQFHKQ